jgi:hypothetical protein
VSGNEEADRQTRLAVEEGSSNKMRLLALLRKGLPQSKAAMWRSAKEKLDRRAVKVRRSVRHKRMSKIDNRLPFEEVYEAGQRAKKASLLF